MKHFNEIKDDEIRIIGRQEVVRKPLYRRWWFWMVLVLILVIVCACLFWLLKPQNDNSDNSECVPSESVAIAPTIVKNDSVSSLLIRDTIINDVPLQLLFPINAVPELCSGINDISDKSIILGLQAADIRADNQKIVGAFVLKGELLSRGIAKKGFCAILGGKIQIGMAESTPLFEETINKNGYFFRQYPLVNQGLLVENNPKNKALRHALCEMDGKIVVINSGTIESFHDFAQALVDLGVENAIALVGGQASGFYNNNENECISWGGDVNAWQKIPDVNFIIWRAITK